MQKEYPAATVVIFGAGKIGTACHTLLVELNSIAQKTNWQFAQQAAPYKNLAIKIVDANPSVMKLSGGEIMDLANGGEDYIAAMLKSWNAKYVFNALPFFLNVKLATAAAQAGCSYIDFTEDDQAAESVRNIYSTHFNVFCAPKCGLAPGFVNYAGADLVRQLREIDPEMVVHALQVRVGALAQNVSFTDETPAESYDLTWSIDGLVNEYIRPCQVRIDGQEREVEALTGKETIIIDGSTYEARYTSGGVGTLIQDYPGIANIDYKTIRVPGHYDYIERVVGNGRNFDAVRDVFQRNFSWTDKDVIIVFAKARGTDSKGTRHVRTYAKKFYGNLGLSAIQTTTAGGGLAVFERLLSHGFQHTNLIGHTSVSLRDLSYTTAYALTYGGKTFTMGTMD